MANNQIPNPGQTPKNENDHNKALRVLGVLFAGIFGILIFCHMTEHNYYVQDSARDCICALIIFGCAGGIVHILTR
jgi:hypothetical protein